MNDFDSIIKRMTVTHVRPEDYTGGQFSVHQRDSFLSIRRTIFFPSDRQFFIRQTDNILSIRNLDIDAVR